MIKLVIGFLLALTLVGCSTMSGFGRDVISASEWTREKMK
jgi:predicted small secreted protein